MDEGALPIDGYGVLKQSRDGAIWINQLVEGIPRAIRYRPDTHPPETEITVSVDRVSLPGNTVFAWQGVDPWMDAPGENFQFSWRLDGGAWSAFSSERYRVFLSLLAGDHTFEVQARDRDFNTDPTPALLRFTVLPQK